ncbi:hypothetical protein [Azospirillum argentinense]|uniref:Uncharacterized protein n=1 Tax=Azospirillum argentinense TaxID=2970906 RepID=A0A5B0KZB1_9PROT|nr:hypothetical protein [Azospirillum argentinense]KAA1057196.1 hypothetical protein FH063_001364 [Azospirillum argentinense]
MPMTEEEARTKWCPHARQSTDNFTTYNRSESGKVDDSCNCVASDCAAWRWMSAHSADDFDLVDVPGDPIGALVRRRNYEGEARRGFCGAFGKPEA